MSSKDRTAPAIRPYRAEDFARLCELDRICFTEGIAYSPEEIWLALAQRGSLAYVAEMRVDERLQVMGFVLAHSGRRKTGHIVTIDIHPDCRRQGLGEDLMKTAEAHLRKMENRRTVLEVAVDNAGAIQFYEKRGYRKRKTLLRYYHDGTDAWLMEKTL